MSYRRPNTGNSMNDYFISLVDFTQLSHHLLEADTEQSFGIWLDKLIAIDKRTTFLFIREHKDEIPDEYMPHIELRFNSSVYKL